MARTQSSARALLATSLLVLLHQVLAQKPTFDPEGPPEGTTQTDGPELHFSSSFYNVSIPENPVGKVYVTPTEKMGVFRIPGFDVRYKIVEGDKDKFFKAEEREVGDFCFLLIRARTGTRDVLNRERKDKFNLKIKAMARRSSKESPAALDYSDVSAPSELEAEVMVRVTVLDTNDLNPLFYPTDYEETVLEDTPLHKSILRVTADDADIGLNGEIYYSFMENTHQFAIHPMTGVVTLTRPLRYNEKATHELTVLARDRSTLLFHPGKSNPSTARLKIHVRPVNLHSPEITVHSLQEVFEQSTNAHTYALVKVNDRDKGVHGEIESLEIVDGDPDGHFRVRETEQKNEFRIELLGLLDREHSPKGYNLTLKASDKGIPQRHSYKNVPVHISDINDNSPIFSKEIYEVEVPESAPINYQIIRLKVNDIDQGKNAKVLLQIVGGNEGGEFSINPKTGMLYTSKLLDTETKSSYALTVSAIDSGRAGVRKQSSAKVKIIIQDTNDNDPLFESSDIDYEMNENEPAGSSVTKVLARDRDSGENAYISYSIVNLNPVPFEIDHFSGVIRTTQVLDYESMRREYLLRIRASDWGQPFRRQTEMQLHIRIKDINDNRPQFEKVSCTGRVSRFVPIGTEIITFSAIDFDAGNIITYRIVSGNEDNCFALDSTSGTLTVTCDLTDLRTDERTINVTATDGLNFADVTFVKMQLLNSKPSHQMLSDAEAAFDCWDTGVARRLTEVLASAEKNNAPGQEEVFAMMPSRYGDNVHSPEFLDFPTQLQINESTALNTVIATLKARDRDLGYNGKMIFGISNGDVDSAFNLNLETGELKVVGYLDRELESEYFLNVTVYDLGKPQKSASRVLPITILDINDNAPKFEKTLASFKVSENAKNGTIIMTLNATDIDEGENSKVVYNLETDTKDFSVHPVSGAVSVAGKLDRERQSTYELKIRASDSSKTRPLSSFALVRVAVDDVNDNAPKFSLDHYSIKVREDIPTETVVAFINAVDPDLGQGGEVKYSLVPGPDTSSSFSIDKNTGTLRLTQPLDFEERQLHSLVIRARDKGTPSLSSEATLQVEVVDVNENLHPPQFSDFVVSVAVAENQPPGAHVAQVVATDKDPPGDDSRISYSIRGGDGVGLFAIDNQGNISTLAVLDRESKRSYWLTVMAQDHGVVPLHSRIEVYVEVVNVNDNTPLTLQPVYYPSIPENSPAGQEVITLEARDDDLEDQPPPLLFRITAGNAESFFTIENGTIRTTGRKLDRENQAEHILEVTVSDQGSPALSSTTRVVVQVEDTNDHAPEFREKYIKADIPALTDSSVFQNDDTEGTVDIAVIDKYLEEGPWETYSPDSLVGDNILRVLAFDADSGRNGEIEYSIKSGRGKGKFRIHPQTGEIFAHRGMQVGQDYDILVKATDHGVPRRSQTCRVNLHVVPVSEDSPNPPSVRTVSQQVTVTESDEPGFLVGIIQAEDKDGDHLWYQIIDGNERNEFYIGRGEGNILLAKKLDWETQNEYKLNISITDGVHMTYAQMLVTVLDVNDHRPRFVEEMLSVDISENIELGTKILQLDATDLDEDKRVFYSLHSARHPSSLSIFKIDSVSGVVSLNEKLDRETIEEHILIVMVKDQGTPSKRNYAQIRVKVHDHNDHAPTFGETLMQAKVFETASVGSMVAQVSAIDLDKGENAKISYAITSGNVGNAFSIDSETGAIQVARDLDMNSNKEYMLTIKATDGGSPSLSSTLRVHIMVFMADNAPPKFVKKDYAAEIFENLPRGTFVIHLDARSTSSLLFEIVEGNVEDMFFVNPSTGVVVTKKPLDYEKVKFYNISVDATNMAGAKASCQVTVHVLDQNDNAPVFTQDLFVGSVSETAEVGALVLTNKSSPLVIKASDVDSEMNAQLHYDIVEAIPRHYFRIDPSTGAIRTVRSFDYEQMQRFTFHVRVSDLGKPRLSSEGMAEVQISVLDVNDCPPVFEESTYNATLLLPTYQDVAVLTVKATDPDSAERTLLRYDIIEGNTGKAFAVGENTGIITVSNTANMLPYYKLHLRVSDGTFSTVTHVNVKVERSENSGLAFQKDVYFGSITENSTKITTVAVVNVLGSALNEHLVFKILNPTDMFVIGPTSGAIKTTGRRFDREEKDNYELIVEARSDENRADRPRVAHVIVNVTILDMNDNCPMFVNLPYYAVVSVDAIKGSEVYKVQAVDMDKGENGEVRYELHKGHGELFKVCRKTGEVTLKQNLEGHNREYELIIGAYDNGITPCSTEVPLHIKVIDRSMPVFDKQFYTDTVLEDIEVLSPLSLNIQAESPMGRKLIYTIEKGNDFEEFALDFNTGAIYVVDELDYEHKKQYELTIRATDSVSGVYAEVIASIRVEDVNDCAPEFTQDSYNISVSEAAPFGTSILKVVSRDNDTGINKKITYKIKKDSENSTEYFHIDADDGSIYLKRSLDHELHRSHHFIVVATDSGIPRLSTTAHVWVSVVDMNDNPPRFEQPSYTCFLSEQAQRLQFVTVVTASDPDSIDQERLTYSIVGGNEQQIFHMDHRSGVISLINMQNFAQQPVYHLNVSITDGVYTSFARVKIDILSANKHNPVFSKPIYEAKITENQVAGMPVTQVVATDKDRNEYGSVKYSIPSDLLSETFEINPGSGDIVSKKPLDREEIKSYEIPVMATDGGGRSAFAQVRVKVLDENDNPPEFLLREARACIFSNFSAGSPIMKVKAVDPDEGSAAEVEYSIYETANTPVAELFTVHRHTGEISLLKSVVGKENQVFQFFVRATDKGTPSLNSDLTVEVLVMNTQDVPPAFERHDDKFFISEYSQPGLIISTVKMSSAAPVKFRIISKDGTEDPAPLFNIGVDGQLTVAGKLDRETKDTYVVTVLAETDDSPPLTVVSDVTIKILDENDNAPKFESNPYTVEVAENVEDGSSILRVIAHDADQSKNKEIRYTFNTDIGDLANVFTIDQFSGWITTLIPLDMEKQSDYKFQVVATDNGNNKHFALTQVHIKIKDYNDNPPVFSESHYDAAVNEDALPGTVIKTLKTSDLDLDVSLVQYYITGGDSRSEFSIRSTGEVFVSKFLDRESIPRYVLDIVATDGEHIAKTKLSIEILDANDNPPYCLRHRYRKVLSEGTQPGTFILTILANDIDEEPNAHLRFYLTGDGADKFYLDKSKGLLKTNRLLDREEQPKYNLVAHVQEQDKPGFECSSLVEILVSDLNDNAPIFSTKLYSVNLPEDTEVGTLVTKVHATDKDIGVNRKVKYALLDSAAGHFKMAGDSGIITLAKPLDREQRAIFNLTVQASDQGTPALSSTAVVKVVVLDINDNPPEFASKNYYAKVPEIAPIGTEIVRVLATSKDTGVNAEISYSIVGGNEHKKFNMNAKTGTLIVAEHLDYERAKEYFLTVQAIDGGNPPLSNYATINITVTDSNDNAPIFNQVSYSARIREDAQVGDKILQVVANDLDSGANGEVSYSIENGDRHEQFFMDKKSGYISVSKQLDREMISSYVLEIQAKDHGQNQLSSTVMVNIDISDANDNPPLFSQMNYSAFIQEDKPPGHSLLKFIVTDADDRPNGAPYTFEFRSGNEDNTFMLEQDGILKTAARFNHKIKDSYQLHIRVYDNGSPPLYSDTRTSIKVIEESQYPPVITPLDISVNSYLDQFPGGRMGRVFATDQDQYDKLSYALAPSPSVPNPSELFEIDPVEGILTALPGLDAGVYQVNVTVSDGKFSSVILIKVNVEPIADEVLQQAVIIRFLDVTPEDFLYSYRKNFIKAIKSTLNVRLKDVMILSLQPTAPSQTKQKIRLKRAAPGLDVLVAVRSPTGALVPAAEVHSALNNNLDDLEAATGLTVGEITFKKCTPGFCKFGECSDRILLDKTQIISVNTELNSFVAPAHLHKAFCQCKEGYDGERCEKIVNECARQPCSSFKVCVPDASPQGYTCQCPEGMAGSTCKIDISKCHNEACYIPRNPVSFSGKSYAQYKMDKNQVKKALLDRLNLSMRIRTMQPAGTLMYAAGKVDYHVLELVNGVVQFRFDLGSGEGLVRVSSTYISDSQWHEIQLTRDSNTARLTIDGKHVAHGSAPGINDVLNLQRDDLYFGAEVRQHPTILGFEDVQRGFSGCMDDIRIDGITLPLHMSGTSLVATLKRFTNVEFHCKQVLLPAGVCGSQPCQNGGTCKEVGNTYKCLCHARFTGLSCEVDLDPCASNPCLHGGRCLATPRSDYVCECLPRLSGKRCEYGRFCNPNPCRNGGVCEEGDSAPMCKCKGFTGELCNVDVDECAHSPCLNGATCINEFGNFRCLCPPNATGHLCGQMLYNTPITAGQYWEEIAMIGAVLFLIFVLVLLFICIRRCTIRRNNKRSSNINNETRKDIVLNSNRSCDVDFKRSSKLSNLEMSQVPPQCPPRPVSYTPSTNNENAAAVAYATALNNLDTSRNYGSAGDELENIPPGYLRNLNRNVAAIPTLPPVPPSNPASDTDSLHKPWIESDLNIPSSTAAAASAVYAEPNKIRNNNVRRAPDLPAKAGLLYSRPQRAMTGASASSLSSLEDDPRMLGGYHWDCSDWNQTQNPLPNITEVPGSEVPDTSSFHSNESNESHSNTHSSLIRTVPLDECRREADGEENGYTVDSEGGTDFEDLAPSSCLQKLLASPILDTSDMADDYPYRGKEAYRSHLNQYLPKPSYAVSESENEEALIPLKSSRLQRAASEDSQDDVVPYGFPQGSQIRLDPDGSIITGIESTGGYTSASDVCDIDDSEFESEPKSRTKFVWPDVTHTQV
ncbi:fat-like cadherin-related tumor suppressor homolog isoform X2 [Neocloeon triangulifer]|uniref:fat-like cadherin-related tumor suppressor homolog isoform X2 n=1 Tax=Neocloeon triangulifer TaxID=2078957 RepID=UPI00286EFF42|nr:fat-like cadherin-related tumor suppressor homolog isoform X2 [Neocloeon triangulifer]